MIANHLKKHYFPLLVKDINANRLTKQEAVMKLKEVMTDLKLSEHQRRQLIYSFKTEIGIPVPLQNTHKYKFKHTGEKLSDVKEKILKELPKEKVIQIIDKAIFTHGIDKVKKASKLTDDELIKIVGLEAYKEYVYVSKNQTNEWEKLKTTWLYNNQLHTRVKTIFNLYEEGIIDYARFKKLILKIAYEYSN